MIAKGGVYIHPYNMWLSTLRKILITWYNVPINTYTGMVTNIAFLNASNLKTSLEIFIKFCNIIWQKLLLSIIITLLIFVLFVILCSSRIFLFLFFKMSCYNLFKTYFGYKKNVDYLIMERAKQGCYILRILKNRYVIMIAELLFFTFSLYSLSLTWRILATICQRYFWKS